MKTRHAIVALALLLASCKARNQYSSLSITSVIPPTATAAGTGVSCKFDPAAVEFTELPYNPAENRGSIAAVVQNNIAITTTLNPLLRTDTTTFLPHQAVVNFEFIPPAAGAPPGQTTVPVSGLEVLNNTKATIGIDIFTGTAINVPDGTFIRATFHLEGKLLDGSLVHSSEREYLFRFCTAKGCGLGGPWAVNNLSCL